MYSDAEEKGQKQVDWQKRVHWKRRSRNTDPLGAIHQWHMDTMSKLIHPCSRLYMVLETGQKERWSWNNFDFFSLRYSWTARRSSEAAKHHQGFLQSGVACASWWRRHWYPALLCGEDGYGDWTMGAHGRCVRHLHQVRTIRSSVVHCTGPTGWGFKSWPREISFPSELHVIFPNLK